MTTAIERASLNGAQANSAQAASGSQPRAIQRAAIPNHPQHTAMTQAVARSVANLDIGQLGRLLAQSGYFKDATSEAKALVKVLYGAEIGVGPVSSMMGMHIIEGKPSPSANLVATMVKKSGRYNYRVTRWDNQGCELMFMERVPGPNGAARWEDMGPSSFTREDAAAAKLLGKAVWQGYAKAMYFARAVTQGTRAYCPDVFGGAPVYTPEELGVEVDGEGMPLRDPEPEFPAAFGGVPLTAEVHESDPSWADDMQAEAAERRAPVCYCGLAARYIRGRSGAGYVCGNYATKAPMCEFRQRDNDPGGGADDAAHAEDLASGAADGVNLADGIPTDGAPQASAPQASAPDLTRVPDTTGAAPPPAPKRGRGTRYKIPEGMAPVACPKRGAHTYVLDGPGGGVRIVDPDGYLHLESCTGLGQAVAAAPQAAQPPVAEAPASSPAPASAAAPSRFAPQTPLSALMQDAALYAWAYDETTGGPNLHRLKNALKTAGITGIAFDNLAQCRAALHTHYKTQPAPGEAAPEAAVEVAA